MIYGNFTWWIGVVEDRDDPMKIGRYRVRILGYHDNEKAVLPTEDLPWASTIQPVGSAAVSGVGHDGTGLVTGSTVIGFFADGEAEQMPVIMGSLGGVDVFKGSVEAAFSDPNGVYPKEEFLDESSLSRLARSGDDAESHISLASRRAMRVTAVPMARPDNFAGVLDTAPTVSNKSETEDDVPRWDDPDPQGVKESVSKYPYNKVRETECGHVFEVDDTPDNKRILNYHTSGSFEEYHDNGDHVQKIVGDDFEIIYKDKTLYVDGDLTMSVKGDVNMKVDGNKIEDIGGDCYTTIRGGRFTKIVGNDVTEIISDQKLSVDGSRFTVIGCQSQDPDVTIPFVGGVPAGTDNLVVKGKSETQIASNKNENIGGRNVISTVAGFKLFSSLGSADITTLKDINLAAGSTSNISLSAGNAYIGSITDTKITATTFAVDASGKATVDGATGVDVLAGSAANIKIDAGVTVDIDGGTSVDVDAPAISLN